MATYPSSLVSFTTKTNKVDLVDAAHINSVQSEVVAIETELGTLVKGTATDLKTRLAVCLAGNGAIVNSPSFPASPVAWQLFGFHGDGKMYFRNAANTQFTPMNQAFSLISTTTVTAAADSAAITIAADKLYKVVVYCTNGGSNAGSFYVEFNASSSGYTWAKTQVTQASPAVSSTDSSTSTGITTGIVLANSIQASTRSYFVFDLDTFLTFAVLTGQGWNKKTGTVNEKIEVAGEWSGTVTSFKIRLDQTWTGKIFLYEYFTS